MSFPCLFNRIYSVYIPFFYLCDHLWKGSVVVSSNSNIMISVTLMDFSTFGNYQVILMSFLFVCMCLQHLENKYNLSFYYITTNYFVLFR